RPRGEARVRTAPARGPGVRRQPAGAAGVLLPPAPGLGRAPGPVSGLPRGLDAVSAARLRGIAALLGTAALALAGCATAPPAPAAGPELTVVTLNIYHDRDGWEQRRPLVIEGLRALQPDVIALQEVLQHE